MNEKILRDWNNADQYLKDNLNNVDGNLNGIVSEVEHIKGTAEGQFVYDSEAKMTKVVPENVNKGIVAMIGGKTIKTKNLIPFPYFRQSGYTTGGVTYTYDSDGIITVTSSSSATANSYFTLVSPDTTMINAITGKTYTLSAKSSSASSKVKFRWYYKNRISGEEHGGTNDFANASLTFKFEPNENDILAIQVYVLTGNNPSNEVITIQLEEGSEATEYELYFDGLHNAPVEKIVTQNKNYTPIENIIYNKAFNSNGNLYDNNDTFAYPPTDITVGETYAIFGIKSLGDLRVVQWNNDALVDSKAYKADANGVFIFVASGNKFAINVLYTNAVFDIITVKGTSINKSEISLSNVLNLPDYGCSAGDVYNYVDFETMIYHHRVGSVDMGTLEWTYSSASSRFYTTMSYVKTSADDQTVANIICSDYTTMTNSDAVLSDMNICFINSQKRTVIKDLAKGTDATEFKTAMSGKILNYELAQEELIDISDILMPFMLETGDTIIFENEHHIDVSNMIIYEKEMI